MARGRGRSFARGPSRKTDWIGWANTPMTAITGNTKTLFAELEFTQPETIVRTRGQLIIGLQTGAADIEVNGAVGMAIVSEAAAATGAGAIPGPWTDNDWDGWFVLQPFSLIFDVTTDIGRQTIQTVIEVDSKAMRKTLDGDTLVVMIETQAAACDFNDMTRHLVKLP